MHEKENNLIGKCGFYCGSCPAYLREECTSCRIAHSEGDCFTFDCVDSQGIDYCGLCEKFPCNEIMTKENVTVLDSRWLKWQKARRESSLYE